jgi:DHA2 family multidrug resistance protein
MTYVTSDWDFWELLWPQIFRGVGLMFAIIPVTNTALGTLPPERVKNASGLFNLMRNLGGAIGLAAINTWFNDRMDLHLTRLHEAVNPTSVMANETLANLAARFQSSDAHRQALARMMAMVRLQAAVLSYADVFLMLTVLFLALAAFALLMKRPKPQAAEGAGH